MSVTVLPVALILEGQGALCWGLVLRGRAKFVTIHVTTPITVQVTASAAGNFDESLMTLPEVLAGTTSITSQATESVNVEAGHEDAKQRELFMQAAEVWDEIQHGQVKPTVSGIRSHLGIAQEQARAIARVVRRWRTEGPGQMLSRWLGEVLVRR